MENIFTRSITDYCERISNGIFSEPINLFSNLLFFISAFLIFKIFKKNKIKELIYWLLLFFITLIGIGSSLWHSFRNPFTLTLDALPIYLFILIFLYLVLRKLLNNKWKPLIFVTSFIVIQVLISILFPKALNGSIRHVINALIFVFLIIWIHKKELLNKYFITSFLLYFFGIIFRSTDIEVCSIFPLGTHFLWHICTSLATYFSVIALLNLEITNDKFS